MIKFLNRVLITAMALSLSSMILAFCLDQTILKADFVTAQADKSGIYTDLAKQLPKQLAGDGETSPAVQSAFEKVVTAEYLQTTFNAYIHNLQSAYESGGAIPPLDLTSLVTQAEALGVPLSPEEKAKLNHQLVIQLDSPKAAGETASDTVAPGDKSEPSVGFSKLYRQTSAAKWILVLTSLISMVLVFVTAPHHRLKALGHGFLATTGWIALYYAFFRMAPGIALHQMQTDKEFSLSGSVNKLITLAASGVAQQLLYAGIATLAIGIILWGLSLLMPHFGTKQGHGSKSDNRTPLPTVLRKD